MLNGYKIIDADSHVFEPSDIWEKYLEPEFKSFALSSDLKIKGEDIVNKVSSQVRREGSKKIFRRSK